MVWFLRIILMFFIVFFIYIMGKRFFTQSRKLEAARKQKRFLLIDHNEVRKNFLLTYKGAIFTGEKYKSSEDTAISITIWPQQAPILKQELMKKDFDFIEKKIFEKYPNAEIRWKVPIQKYLQDS
ncbi:sigma-w pathway protein ysdB [Bacillus sp. MUM 116]|uniref:sigma-w pathway protein ysdB n=1 Tax=Bacillus sp. MUM 116 TaxID=1678002 RepID=UPI0008F58132|nr:sigma-w pathway protein ysdB [Bacillus sp. MUM 116]OIK10018.1 sigma-w pathway protein ysdB [Bacillus sp. MUM 116]